MNEHYATVLADLQRMKEDAEEVKRDAEAGIRAIQKLMTRAAGGQSAELPEFQNGIKASRPVSIPTKISAFLNQNPSRSCNIKEVSEAVGGNLKTVRGALVRMESKGKIIRAGRGKYKAKVQKSKDATDQATGSAAA